MTQISWRDNKHVGAFVERQLRSLEAYIESQQDGAVKIQALKDFVYIWDIKARVAKGDNDREQDERLDKLEKLAGIAHKTVAPTV